MITLSLHKPFPMNLHELHADVKFPCSMDLRIAMQHYWLARGWVIDEDSVHQPYLNEDGILVNPFASPTGVVSGWAFKIDEFVKL